MRMECLTWPFSTYTLPKMSSGSAIRPAGGSALSSEPGSPKSGSCTGSIRCSPLMFIYPSVGRVDASYNIDSDKFRCSPSLTKTCKSFLYIFSGQNIGKVIRY